MTAVAGDAAAKRATRPPPRPTRSINAAASALSNDRAVPSPPAGVAGVAALPLLSRTTAWTPASRPAPTAPARAESAHPIGRASAIPARANTAQRRNRSSHDSNRSRRRFRRIAANTNRIAAHSTVRNRRRLSRWMRMGIAINPAPAAASVGVSSETARGEGGWGRREGGRRMNICGLRFWPSSPIPPPPSLLPHPFRDLAARPLRKTPSGPSSGSPVSKVRKSVSIRRQARATASACSVMASR